MSQQLIFTNDVASAIDSIHSAVNPASTFVLVDSNTISFVLPRLKSQSAAVASASIIEVQAGDVHKSLDSLASIWKRLGDMGATRRSMLINLGGGMVTDMGAFAASTFKRGITFVNVPTTLLGAVDASVGGKTGINFNGLKNEVGVFREAEAVIISTTFFGTLSHTELLSGYAEMLKHGLISSPAVFNSLLATDVADIDPDHMLSLLRESVQVKRDVVDSDPTEQGPRKALNLGHTAGHAFESLAMKRNSPVPHGYAVAWGLVVELILSGMILKFPSSLISQFAAYVYANYRAMPITCDDYPALLDLMRHDKKNATAASINFTLLRAIGDVCIDSTASDEQISQALDIYRDLMHL